MPSGFDDYAFPQFTKHLFGVKILYRRRLIFLRYMEFVWHKITPSIELFSCQEIQSMPTKLEKTAYPVVEKWMKRHFLCFKTATNTGLRHSRVDVIGVRDIGGDLSGDVETIAIEVKRGLDPFATASGQTLGYNVYANRVYLADRKAKKFSQDELQIASHLGIGLIRIQDTKCTEVLSSPFYGPIRRLNLLLLDQLGLGRCQLCGCFFETGGTKRECSKLTRE